MKTNYFNKPITKRFIDAFPKFKDENNEKTYFWETWKQSPFYIDSLTENDLKYVYNYLLASYYSHHFRFIDDFGIALNVMKIINEYYPNVKARLELAEELRELSLEEFKKSGMHIQSAGQNPKTKTQMNELINLVDTQNASFQMKSEEQTIRAKFMALLDGIMEDFGNKFKPLFVTLYGGLTNYIYENEKED